MASKPSSKDALTITTRDRTNVLGDSNPWSKQMTSELAKRPGFGTTGKNALINVNAYPVTNFPNKTVYQYDLVIGSGDEKRGLNHVVVESQSFKKAVGPGFLFDGNKLGW